MNVGSIGATTTADATARQSLSGNFDTFLRLLTTQLQNQDPLEPMDATKFTEQLVSYSQVEQQIATNDKLNSLISMTWAGIGSTAVSYLDKTVLTSGTKSQLDDGAASWRYTLPSDANTLTIQIKDSSGKVVRTIAGQQADKTVGPHDFTWDGKNDAGAALGEGEYSLSVVARKADSTDITTQINGLGRVTELDMSGSEPLLSIGGRKVTLLEVIGFKN
jgi:flagellar basal-body rod modification protein FlgD